MTLTTFSNSFSLSNTWLLPSSTVPPCSIQIDANNPNANDPDSKILPFQNILDINGMGTPPDPSKHASKDDILGFPCLGTTFLENPEPQHGTFEISVRRDVSSIHNSNTPTETFTPLISWRYVDPIPYLTSDLESEQQSMPSDNAVPEPSTPSIPEKTHINEVKRLKVSVIDDDFVDIAEIGTMTVGKFDPSTQRYNTLSTKSRQNSKSPPPSKHKRSKSRSPSPLSPRGTGSRPLPPIPSRSLSPILPQDTQDTTISHKSDVDESTESMHLSPNNSRKNSHSRKNGRNTTNDVNVKSTSRLSILSQGSLPRHSFRLSETFDFSPISHNLSLRISFDPIFSYNSTTDPCRDICPIPFEIVKEFAFPLERVTDIYIQLPPRIPPPPKPSDMKSFYSLSFDNQSEFQYPSFLLPSTGSAMQGIPALGDTLNHFGYFNSTTGSNSFQRNSTTTTETSDTFSTPSTTGGISSSSDSNISGTVSGELLDLDEPKKTKPRDVSYTSRHPNSISSTETRDFTSRSYNRQFQPNSNPITHGLLGPLNLTPAPVSAASVVSDLLINSPMFISESESIDHSSQDPNNNNDINNTVFVIIALKLVTGLWGPRMAIPLTKLVPTSSDDHTWQDPVAMSISKFLDSFIFSLESTVSSLNIHKTHLVQSYLNNQSSVIPDIHNDPINSIPLSIQEKIFNKALTNITTIESSLEQIESKLHPKHENTSTVSEIPSKSTKKPRGLSRSKHKSQKPKNRTKSIDNSSSDPTSKYRNSSDDSNYKALSKSRDGTVSTFGPGIGSDSLPLLPSEHSPDSIDDFDSSDTHNLNSLSTESIDMHHSASSPNLANHNSTSPGPNIFKTLTKNVSRAFAYAGKSSKSTSLIDETQTTSSDDTNTNTVGIADAGGTGGNLSKRNSDSLQMSSKPRKISLETKTLCIIRKYKLLNSLYHLPWKTFVNSCSIWNQYTSMKSKTKSTPSYVSPSTPVNYVDYLSSVFRPKETLYSQLKHLKHSPTFQWLLDSETPIPSITSTPSSLTGVYTFQSKNTNNSHLYPITKDPLRFGWIKYASSPIPFPFPSLRNPFKCHSIEDVDLSSDSSLLSVSRMVSNRALTPEMRRIYYNSVLGGVPFDLSILHHRGDTSIEPEFEQLQYKRRETYLFYKSQWMSITPDQAHRNSRFRDIYRIICKDTLRTETEYRIQLRNVLLTWSMYNFDIGYVQGMSDILSPLLSIAQGDEVEAFFLFIGMMEKHQLWHNYRKDQSGVNTQLGFMNELVNAILPSFGSYLETIGRPEFFFCYRWFLVCFKRELSKDDTLVCWDHILSSHIFTDERENRIQLGIQKKNTSLSKNNIQNQIQDQNQVRNSLSESKSSTSNGNQSQNDSQILVEIDNDTQNAKSKLPASPAKQNQSEQKLASLSASISTPMTKDIFLESFDWSRNYVGDGHLFYDLLLPLDEKTGKPIARPAETVLVSHGLDPDFKNVKYHIHYLIALSILSYFIPEIMHRENIEMTSDILILFVNSLSGSTGKNKSNRLSITQILARIQVLKQILTVNQWNDFINEKSKFLDTQKITPNGDGVGK